ncbi:hypothetical protein S7335_4795 [Synechococcus sp. PCC 7335]|uniref:terpene synthase family protein n=1 Tax=Synechococcus sp. (strain ATCC 29403 / PCC 7335) TaxID=91464 RepID=UPI00017EE7F9|nr:hypothetical protein [Synechococcus sp. PCC 7335]EDX87088.1 hypothetical protein S7335_4795 [Synechococcus sp. PCC 7335]
MKTAQPFSYQFARFEQPADKCLYLHSFIADYISRHQLFRKVERYTKIIGLFMRFCSPPDISFQGLNAICMFTTLSFFIDDQADKDNNCYLERFQSIIKGLRSPETNSENALIELLDFADRLSGRAQMNSDSFRQHLLNYIAAQQWERERISRSPSDFSLEGYYQYRPDAIALFPYLALLKLSEKIDELRFHPLQRSQLLFLEQLAAKIAYLDNDICSWQSERTEPTALNLVKVLKEESLLSWEKSLQEVTRIRNSTVERYVHNRDQLLQEADSIELRNYFSMLECSVTGNYEAMQHLKQQQLRYEPAELVTV